MTATALTLEHEATDEELKSVSDGFEGAPPDVVLRWALEEFGDDVALATGFGVEGCVLVDALARVDRGARVFYLDTDLLFPDTYALIERLRARYGVRFERRATRLSLEAQAARHGERLWERDPAECCRLRKVEPLREALAELRAWVTAIRRDQTAARAGAGIVERDAKFGLVKINPLAAWSSRDVWNYVAKHDVPYNPLHDLGYPSVGCTPCTTLVRIGEDPRAGRWRGTSKTECGIHGR
ncbi:MAG TPA: phosphoadenylyl-sulfate reductase [Pyrinomonadaceae bacterium]|nr:phosphoadenylyl-sulfate reductase [Pyrinomonadaceae bacterium]